MPNAHSPLAGQALPRLMAFDLDGTLLDPSGRVTPRVAQALQAAHDAGVMLALATGRPPFMLGNVIEAVGPAITHGVMSNGAMVCTFPDGATLRTVHFDFQEAVAIITKLRSIDSMLGFALATDVGFSAEPGFIERMPAPGQLPVSSDVLVDSAGATIVAKLFVFHHRLDAYELIAKLAPHVDGNFDVYHMGAEAVEVGVAGVDKASGLQWLCDHLEISASDVITFGDNTNDHSMLAWAGRSVAMGNAAASTQALADHIAPSNAHDGVAVFIEQLLLESADH